MKMKKLPPPAVLLIPSMNSNKLMKLIKYISFFLIVLQSSAFASYYSFGISSGDNSGKTNLTIEGGIEKNKLFDTDLLTGVSLFFLLHEDSQIPAGTYDEPCPNNNFTNLGKKNEGSETGLLLKGGKSFLLEGLYFNGILGISRAHTIDLVRSNISGEYYIQDKSDEIHPIIGISSGYFHDFSDYGLHMNIQIDLDSRRGLTFLFGFFW